RALLGGRRALVGRFDGGDLDAAGRAQAEREPGQERQGEARGARRSLSAGRSIRRHSFLLVGARRGSRRAWREIARGVPRLRPAPPGPLARFGAPWAPIFLGDRPLRWQRRS